MHICGRTHAQIRRAGRGHLNLAMVQQKCAYNNIIIIMTPPRPVKFNRREFRLKVKVAGKLRVRSHINRLHGLPIAKQPAICTPVR